MRAKTKTMGSALLVAITAMAVLAFIAAAAILIASRERGAASAKGRQDMMRACAEAAARMVWAEMANQGGVLTGAIWARNIPGGPQLTLGHVGDSFDTVTLSNIGRTMKEQADNSAGGGLTDVDTASTFRKAFFGRPSTIYAHCVDRSGREYEVELFARFGL